ncbi:hypothetical protein TNCV_844701 [Trichonephila clavipes]|uniref:Uncharacterized protein n=1 Tax=Trichonephila clavipes TaxID=2585209 RepID=A0A8X7BK20_TRICX|nr:hypothetical protein TNCV_844701 [Trichonephila clavipes]
MYKSPAKLTELIAVRVSSLPVSCHHRFAMQRQETMEVNLSHWLRGKRGQFGNHKEGNFVSQTSRYNEDVRPYIRGLSKDRTKLQLHDMSLWEL